MGLRRKRRTFRSSFTTRCARWSRVALVGEVTWRRRRISGWWRSIRCGFESLINLVANAILHSHSGAAVSLAVTQTSDWLMIRVTDNGPGIAQQDLSRIFDRFHKGPRSQGSGLGLAIARQLVEAHEGEIGAESTVGVGTTFTVRIPHRTVGGV